MIDSRNSKKRVEITTDNMIVYQDLLAISFSPESLHGIRLVT